MKILYTNGENKDFISLCDLLDEDLNDQVGGEVQRKNYIQYNKLNHIHDVFVAYEKELPIGCASFKHYEEKIAEVKRVYVKKDFRGRGISKLLMEQIEKKALELGYQYLILETGKTFLPAVSLYQGLGYDVIDNYGQYKGMPFSICMKKKLINDVN